MRNRKTLQLLPYLLLHLGLINGLINAVVNYCVGFLLFRNFERIFLFGKSKSIIGDTFITTFIVTWASIFITLEIVNRHFNKFHFILDVVTNKRIGNFLLETKLFKDSWLRGMIGGIFLGSILSCLMAVIFLILRINNLTFQQILWYKVIFSFAVAFLVSVMVGYLRVMYLQEERIR